MAAPNQFGDTPGLLAIDVQAGLSGRACWVAFLQDKLCACQRAWVDIDTGGPGNGGGKSPLDEIGNAFEATAIKSGAGFFGSLVRVTLFFKIIETRI